MNFRTVRNPSDAELQPLQSASPANPFASIPYAAARRALGQTVVLFAADTPSGASACAIGYESGHPLSRNLEITSAPYCANAADFWDGVRDFCRENHVAYVTVDSYGSGSVTLPTWPAPTQMRDRTEWLLQLGATEPLLLSSSHRRNINKARKFGVRTTCTTDPAAARVHCRLMAASMQRRALRGEDVPDIEDENARYDCAFLASGAARIFQAEHDGNVVSSLLVLNAPTGAYYQSAGTTPEGMEIGASTFLISQVAGVLAAESKTVFNLGGAGPESEGLKRFKSGFGAEPVPLHAASYQLASPIHRKLMAAARLLRNPFSLGEILSRPRGVSRETRRVSNAIRSDPTDGDET